MKLKIILSYLLVILTASSFAQKMNVASFNLRMDTKKDTGNLWVDRAPLASALIQFHDFDVFGTQEGFLNQLEDISNALPQFDRYGAGRDDGKSKGEHAAIFFKKNLFKLIDKGDFWLSETPDKPSLGWDATCCKRICSWVYLEHKQSKKRFYFFNAHYDHQGVIARNESSNLILKKIKEIAKGKPVILSGDFNGGHNSDWYLSLANSGVLKDSYKLVQQPYAFSGSFNSFGRALPGKEIIDHIFVSKDFDVNRWGILTDSFNGKFPSDHFPILIEVNL